MSRPNREPALSDVDPTMAASREGRPMHWMEEIIGEAQRRGDFDDLPGKGKPLHLDDSDPFAGPEAEAYKVLKEAGFTPEWVPLRRKITEQIVWLREHPQHPERISRLVEVNAAIGRHNRLIPNPSLAFPKVPADIGR